MVNKNVTRIKLTKLLIQNKGGETHEKNNDTVNFLPCNNGVTIL